MIAHANDYQKQKADYILLKPAQHSLGVFSNIQCGMYEPVGLYQVSDEYRDYGTHRCWKNYGYRTNTVLYR